MKAWVISAALLLLATSLGSAAFDQQFNLRGALHRTHRARHRHARRGRAHRRRIALGTLRPHRQRVQRAIRQTRRVAHVSTRRPAQRVQAAAITSTQPKKSRQRIKMPLVHTWRGAAKYSLARSASGGEVSAESFTSLDRLLDALPDDGEIRVRHGIYLGKSRGPVSRFEEEQRTVRVSCWIHAVRFGTMADKNEEDIQLILGSSADSASARYLVAEIPGALTGSIDEPLFASARKQLTDMFPSTPISSRFQRVAPASVEIEGSLFFDGMRGVGRLSAWGADWARLSTVWEIHPVTSIAATVALR